MLSKIDLLIVWCYFSVLCGIVAIPKGKNPILWFLIGIVFGPLGLFVLLGQIKWNIVFKTKNTIKSFFQFLTTNKIGKVITIVFFLIIFSFFMVKIKQIWDHWSSVSESKKKNYELFTKARNTKYYFMDDKEQRMEEICNKIIDLNKNTIFDKNILGYAYYQLDRYNLAYDLLEDVVKEDSDTAITHLLLADIYNDKGQFALAMEETYKAEKMDFGEELPQIFKMRSSIFFKQDKHKEAIEYLEKAVKLDKKNYSLHQRLIKGYFLTHQYQKALEACSQALQVFPRHGEIAMFKGAIYLELQDFERAVKFLEKAWSKLEYIEGHETDILNDLIDCYNILSNEPKVKYYCSILSKNYPQASNENCWLIFRERGEYSLELMGIIRGGEPMAIIDNRFYKTGDTVGLYKIIQIKSNSVIFKDDGQNIEISVGDSLSFDK